MDLYIVTNKENKKTVDHLYFEKIKDDLCMEFISDKIYDTLENDKRATLFIEVGCGAVTIISKLLIHYDNIIIITPTIREANMIIEFLKKEHCYHFMNNNNVEKIKDLDLKTKNIFVSTHAYEKAVLKLIKVLGEIKNSKVLIVFRDFQYLKVHDENSFTCKILLNKSHNINYFFVSDSISLNKHKFINLHESIIKYKNDFFKQIFGKISCINYDYDVTDHIYNPYFNLREVYLKKSYFKFFYNIFE